MNSSNKQSIMCIYCEPGPVLGTGATGINTTEEASTLMGWYILSREGSNVGFVFSLGLGYSYIFNATTFQMSLQCLALCWALETQR